MSGTPPVPPAPPSTPFSGRAGGGGAGMMSEEARLRAQRRYLEERFGVGDETLSGELPGPVAPVTSSADVSSAEASQAVTPASVVVSESRPPLPASAVAAAVAAAAIEARSEQQGEEAETDDTKEDSMAIAANEDQALPIWPGTCYAPGTSTIMFNSDLEACQERTMPVRTVTKFARAYPSLPSSSVRGRRIAVDERLISYPVEKQIRVIGRQSAARTILKGHEGIVLDICFSQASELPILTPQTQLSPLSVLGSCAADGSVFIWFLHEVPTDDATPVQDDSQLSCVYSIDLTHPSKGAFYSRIQFCSQSKTARFALLDSTTGVIRIILDVSQSAIDEQTIEATNDPNASIADICWLDSATLLSCTSTGQTSLWNVDNRQCIFNFNPVNQPSTLQMMFALTPQNFVLVSDNATKIQFWTRDRTGPKEKNPSLSQEINIMTKHDSRNLVAIDPLSEFLVVSSAGGGSILVLQIDKILSCVTCVTEVPMRKAPLTISLTRTIGSVVRTDARGVREATTEDELGLWSIHEKSVQLQILNAENCRLHPDVTTEVPSSIAPSPRPKVDEGGDIVDDADAGGMEKPTESTSPRDSSQPSLPRVQENGDKMRDNLAEDKDPLPSPGKPVTQVQSSKVSTVDKDMRSAEFSSESVSAEITRCMKLETDKMIKKLEQQFAERDELDRQQLARLLTNVESTAKANVAFFVGEALPTAPTADMKKSLCLSIDEIIADILGTDSLARAIDDSLVSVSNNPVLDKVEKLSAQIDLSAEIHNALAKSGLLQNYAAACNVMASQIRSSLSTQVQMSLGEELIRSIEAATAAVLRVEKASDDLVSKSRSTRAEQSAVDVDYRSLVEEKLGNEMYNDALLSALMSQNDELLEWFLLQLSGMSLSSEPPCNFSNVALLSVVSGLADQLHGDVMRKLEWMVEIFLNIDFEDPMLEPVLDETLGRVDKEIEFLVSSTQVELTAERKKAKVLRRLVAASSG